MFYTDGISEARDEQGEFYPLQRRGALLAGLDPAPALDLLYSDILRHVGHELNDDCVALIVCRSNGFQGTWTNSDAAPTAFTLNGATCST